MLVRPLLVYLSTLTVAIELYHPAIPHIQWISWLIGSHIFREHFSNFVTPWRFSRITWHFGNVIQFSQWTKGKTWWQLLAILPTFCYSNQHYSPICELNLCIINLDARATNVCSQVRQLREPLMKRRDQQFKEPLNWSLETKQSQHSGLKRGDRQFREHLLNLNTPAFSLPPSWGLGRG